MTKEDAVNDFENLQKIDCNNINEINKGSRLGANFVDYFTMLEKLETKGKGNFNFYDFWENKSKYAKKNYVIKLFKYYHKENPNYTPLQIWFRLFNLYFGAINIFKPILAMEIYCKFRPKNILDFTMGWGGRLVGACALNINSYTGIDLNKKLEQPYNEMVKVLKEHSTTNIKLIFKSALEVDYSKLDYDLVLTSPPYYNIEIYSGQPKMDKETWNKEFYEPLFTQTFKYLKRGGHYCLNVPKEVYDNVCINVLGKADIFIPLYKSKRTKDETYKEFIYVWTKGIQGGSIENPVLPKPTFTNDFVEARKSKVTGGGYGLFAKQDIPIDTRITDAIGEEMPIREFKERYGEYKDVPFLYNYTYKLGRANRIISSKEKKYLTKNPINYVNEISQNFNVLMKKRGLYSSKNIKKGEELSLEYPRTYNRYWLK